MNWFFIQIALFLNLVWTALMVLIIKKNLRWLFNLSVDPSSHLKCCYVVSMLNMMTLPGEWSKAGKFNQSEQIFISRSWLLSDSLEVCFSEAFWRMVCREFSGMCICITLLTGPLSCCFGLSPNIWCCARHNRLCCLRMMDIHGFGLQALYLSVLSWEIPRRYTAFVWLIVLISIEIS